jgi:glycosyltransferase involved in cell wall biosynthesis
MFSEPLTGPLLPGALDIRGTRRYVWVGGGDGSRAQAVRDRGIRCAWPGRPEATDIRITPMHSTSPRTPRLSVIIPCRNMGATIGDQLEALANQSWSEPWEIIVSDNGSSDDSVRVVERYTARLPHLRLVDASGRLGSSHARNVGARAATAPALAFCDADDEVGPGWVAAMATALTSHDFVACRFDVGRFNKRWVRHPQEQGLQELWYPPYLPVAGSGGLGVKRALHDAVGGFDESLRRLMDTDYCLRIQLRGVPLVFVKDAVVHYRTLGGSGWTFQQAREWAEHNVLMYKRYRGDMRMPQPWRRYLIHWTRLHRRLGAKAREERFYEVIGRAGWQLGLLLGSLKYRTTPVPPPWPWAS